MVQESLMDTGSSAKNPDVRGADTVERSPHDLAEVGSESAEEDVSFVELPFGTGDFVWRAVASEAAHVPADVFEADIGNAAELGRGHGLYDAIGTIGEGQSASHAGRYFGERR